jgi:hypothetical protein
VRRIVAGLVVTSLALLVALATGVGTAAAAGQANGTGVKDVGSNYKHGKKLAISTQESEQVSGQPPQGNAKVGSVRTWLGLDDFNNRIYLKNYTLRGVGNHIEVWVANNLAFPDHKGKPDCRNTLGLTTVTDAQIQGFISEFDSNILPKESEAFSVAPARDGHKAVLPTLIPNLPSSEYKGEGDNTVVLVDNVRDANYYEPTSDDGKTYIAGFFYSVFNEYFNRNVMTIDAFDWIHRTGASPPSNAGTAEYLACASELGLTGDDAAKFGRARPHLYEGVFAHEYQHLLEYYADTDEVSWVNEGLSDWAQTLVGYVDPRVPQNPDGPGTDSHFRCFEGWDPTFGGPENSLTSWGDQGQPEILCDYGAAYSIMQMLATRYGDSFMSALHTNPGNGLAGVDAVLNSFATGKTAEQVVHEWAALMALDNQASSSLTGGSTADYTSSGLWSTINWANPEAYDAPGAPANGSDYVPLGPVSGLTSIDFQGSASLPPTPVAWTSGAAPGAASPPVLISGAANNRDEAIVRSVTFGASPTLTFDAQWNEETGWDFGFVQISTDNGETYKSLSCTDTTSDHDPGALPTAVQNVPGFTGDSGGWKAQTCDVSTYANQSVLLSFRAFNDPGTLGSGSGTTVPPGFYVDNVEVDGSVVSDGTLTGWQSPTEVNPVAVNGFTVQLVAYDGAGNAWIFQLPLDGSFHGSLNGAALQAALGTTATTVGALVMYDEPTESVLAEAPYTLTVNGVVQPGGS